MVFLYEKQAEAIATEHVVTVVKCKVDYSKFSPFFKFKIESNAGADYKYYNVIVSKSFPVYNQFNFIVSAYIALKRSSKKVSLKLFIVIIHIPPEYGLAG